MQSLFPNRPEGSSNASELISFNAGKCHLSTVGVNGKIKVSPDLRKGKITLERSADGLLHFKWGERTNGRAEDDVIIFPGDIVFKRVTTPVASDRVYLLKFRSSNAKRMYWMQDKSDENDQNRADKINDFANNPQAIEAELASRGIAPAQDPFMQMMGLQNPGALGGMGIPGMSGFPGLQLPPAQQPQPNVDNLGLGTLDLSDLMAQFVNPVTRPAQTPAATVDPRAAPTPNTADTSSIETVSRDLFPETPAQQQPEQPVAVADNESQQDLLSLRVNQIIDESGNILPAVLAHPDVAASLSTLLPEGYFDSPKMRELFTNFQSPVRMALSQIGLAIHNVPDLDVVSFVCDVDIQESTHPDFAEIVPDIVRAILLSITTMFVQ